MISTYKAFANELDENLINSIKSIYLNKNIQIVVSEIPNDYSLSEMELAKRIYEVENGINVVKFTVDEFDDLVDKLSGVMKQIIFSCEAFEEFVNWSAVNKTIF